MTQDVMRMQDPKWWTYELMTTLLEEDSEPYREDPRPRTRERTKGPGRPIRIWESRPYRENKNNSSAMMAQRIDYNFQSKKYSI